MTEQQLTIEDDDFWTPYDWEALQHGVMHALGLIDSKHCYACYSIAEAEYYANEHENI